MQEIIDTMMRFRIPEAPFGDLLLGGTLCIVLFWLLFTLRLFYRGGK